jgi:hypothetical protein
VRGWRGEGEGKAVSQRGGRVRKKKRATSDERRPHPGAPPLRPRVWRLGRAPLPRLPRSAGRRHRQDKKGGAIGGARAGEGGGGSRPPPTQQTRGPPPPPPPVSGPATRPPPSPRCKRQQPHAAALVRRPGRRAEDTDSGRRAGGPIPPFARPPPPPPSFSSLTKVRVDADLPEFILDDRHASALLLAQDAVDQGRLAGAQKS